MTARLPTLAYPFVASRLTDPSVPALWQMTSLLAGTNTIATKLRSGTLASRGFVVGARFDSLLESIQTLLGKEP